MPAYPQIYLADDTTLHSTVAVSIDAGDASTTYERHLWNDKGSAYGDATAMTGIALAAEWWDGSAWQRSGHSVVDQMWVEVKCIGQDKTGDSTMSTYTTGAMRIGATSRMVLPDIPQGCAHKLEITLRVPSSAAEATPKVQIVVDYEQSAYALAEKTSLGTGAGVIPDYMISGMRRLRYGGALTGSGTADVTYAALSMAYDGSVITILGGTSTLNQTDGDGAALAAGDSYIAILSAKSDGTITATKGSKAVAPTAPTMPTDEVYLGTVTVDYQLGGTSVIDQADIDQTTLVKGEYLVEAGTGLNVTIHAGEAISPTDQKMFTGSASSLAMTGSTTNYVWLQPDGTLSKTTTLTAPSVGAFRLATVVADVGTITSVTDTRPWAGIAHTISLRKTGAINATATDCDYDVVPPGTWMIEQVEADLVKQGAAASGSTKVDVLYRASGVDISTGATTIYTNNATSDQRPAITYNTNRATPALYHEVTSVTGGQRLTFDVVAVPGTITTDPEDLRVSVRLRKVA